MRNHTRTARPCSFTNLSLFLCGCLILSLCPGLSSALEAQPAPHQGEAANAACFTSLAAEAVSLQPCESALYSSSPDSIERAHIHSVLAMLHAKRQDLYAARRAMDAALAITADDVIVQGNLGSLLVFEGRYAGAIAAFDLALAAQPAGTQSAALYLNRSLALRAMGRYDEAAADYAYYLTLSGFGNPADEIESSPPAELESDSPAEIQSGSST